jgi:hypothetical protein
MQARALAAIMVVALGGAAQAQLVLSVPADAHASGHSARMEAQAQEPAPSKVLDHAQPKTVPPSGETSRFQFNSVNGGFLRFDSQTGKMAYCSPHTIGWNCQAVPEDRSALEQEIAHLNDEIAALRKQIDDLRAKPAPPPKPPAPVPPPAAAPDKNGNLTLKLPSQADIGRARAYVEGALQDTWRRLVEFINRFQKNVKQQT